MIEAVLESIHSHLVVIHLHMHMGLQEAIVHLWKCKLATWSESRGRQKASDVLVGNWRAKCHVWQC